MFCYNSRAISLLLVLLIHSVCGLSQPTREERIQKADSLRTATLEKRNARRDSVIAAKDSARKWRIYQNLQLVDAETSPLKGKPIEEPTYQGEPLLDSITLGNYREILVPEEEERKETVRLIRSPVDRLNRLNYQITFYGSTVNVLFENLVNVSLWSYPDTVKINHLWAQFDQSNYLSVSDSLRYKRKRDQLNDWGFCLLANETAKRMYPLDKNAQAVLCAYLLDKQGFITALAYHQSRLYPVFASGDLIYDCRRINVPSIDRKDISFYAINFSDFHGIHGPVSLIVLGSLQNRYAVKMRMKESPLFPLSFRYRNQSFNDGSNQVTFRLSLNPYRIDYYHAFPNVELKTYLTCPLGSETRTTLYPQIRRKLQSLPDDIEKVQFLLYFVQSLPYRPETDHYQDFLFPEETLENGGDCEDKVILFAALVRELLGLEVAFLQFEEHLAAAVQLNHPVVQGTVYIRGGKTFVACDPTGKSALVGHLKNHYRKQKPLFIRQL